MTSTLDSLRVVMLTGPGEPTNIVFNGLAKRLTLTAIIQEPKQATRLLLTRRLRRLGPSIVFGQVAFQAVLAPLLRIEAYGRIRQVLADHQLDVTPVPQALVRNVPSANDASTIQLLGQLDPDVVIVQGTRILSNRVLRAVACPFINMHVGITPYFRGVHGAYWALRQRRPDLCGVTVHFVDPGIDTGSPIAQATIRPSRADNFVSYPYLQFAAGIPLLAEAARSVCDGTLEVTSATMPPAASQSELATSRLWTHPTAWDYLWHRLRSGVR